MRRHAVVLFVVLVCLLAGAVQAAEIRFPKTGTNAFLINLPAGWTAKPDDYNGMQLLPDDRRSSVYLSVVRDAAYAGKPLLDLALAIGKASSITQFAEQEPAAISGRKGTAFCGQMKNDKGACARREAGDHSVRGRSVGDGNVADLAGARRRVDRLAQSGGQRDRAHFR